MEPYLKLALKGDLLDPPQISALRSTEFVSHCIICPIHSLTSTSLPLISPFPVPRSPFHIPTASVMDDMAELALEGATKGIDNYEKVYDPLKARVQNMHNPMRRFSKPDQSRYRDEYDDEPPSTASVDRRSSRQENGRSGNGRSVNNGRGYVKETYYRESGRAKSAGRDGYNGEGWGRDLRGRGPSQSSIFCFRLLQPRASCVVVLAHREEAPHEIT